MNAGVRAPTDICDSLLLSASGLATQPRKSRVVGTSVLEEGFRARLHSTACSADERIAICQTMSQRRRDIAMESKQHARRRSFETCVVEVGVLAI